MRFNSVARCDNSVWSLGLITGYRLTDNRKRAAAMFVLFHRRTCGLLPYSLFLHWPYKTVKPPARIVDGSPGGL